MSWITELGVGLILGALVIGLVLFHVRSRSGTPGKGTPMPLDPQDARRLGYLSVGARAARRLQGDVPIIFEWQDGPVWRTAIDDAGPMDLDAPDVQILLARLGGATVTPTERSLEVRGGVASTAEHHLAAAELLSLLRRRLSAEG